MRRRTFMQSALAGSAAALAAPTQGIPKRTYKGDVKVSMIAFGGIVVVGLEQKDAGRAVAEAFDRGVNYFDVAPSYFSGEAEMKLGPALAPYRAKSFLACKTMERGAAGARQELEQSLGRLRTDHFDLYQFHAVSSVAEVDRILAAGGAAETFVKAREEGKVRFLGASVHEATAAISLMDRFSLDSVMISLNFVLVHEGNFGPQILAKAKEKGVAALRRRLSRHARRAKYGSWALPCM